MVIWSSILSSIVAAAAAAAVRPAGSFWWSRSPGRRQVLQTASSSSVSLGMTAGQHLAGRRWLWCSRNRWRWWRTDLLGRRLGERAWILAAVLPHRTSWTFYHRRRPQTRHKDREWHWQTDRQTDRQTQSWLLGPPTDSYNDHVSRQDITSIRSVRPSLTVCYLLNWLPSQLEYGS